MHAEEPDEPAGPPTPTHPDELLDHASAAVEWLAAIHSQLETQNQWMQVVAGSVTETNSRLEALNAKVDSIALEVQGLSESLEVMEACVLEIQTRMIDVELAVRDVEMAMSMMDVAIV